MQPLGQLKRNKKAAGSIIGATFLALILLSGFTFYNLYITINKNYQDLLLTMDQLDLRRKQENLEFVSITTTSGNKLNITVRNIGAHQIHLTWLGIFDEISTPYAQDYYELDVGINPAVTVTDIPEAMITILDGQVRVIQLVTELGNIFNYNYPTSTTDSAQSRVTITGKNCTTSSNPSQWSLFGSTTNASGSVANLASNDGSYAVFNSYPSSSSLVNITLLDDGFEEVDWDSNWDQYGGDWERVSYQSHSGTYSAEGDRWDSYLTSDNLDASGATYIYVEFWFMKDGIENYEFTLDYWDGNRYDFIQDLDLLGFDGVWIKYGHKITDSQYFRSDFHIRFGCVPLWSGERVWVDDVIIKKESGSGQCTASVEFIGSSSTADWSRLIWQTDSSWNIGQVNVTIQYYNFTLNAYSTSGNGYANYISDATPNTDEAKTQTITSNPRQFKNSTGHWKVKITGEKATSTQYHMRVDWIEIKPTYDSAGLTIPYNGLQWFTIATATANGNSIPYAYVTIYANGTSLVLQNASDEQVISNPSWLRLDVNGEFQLYINSTSGSAETFTLYAVVGSALGQKTITQEAP